jgi:hypothetical protein
MLRKWTEGMNLIISCFPKDTILNNLTASLLAPSSKQRKHEILAFYSGKNLYCGILGCNTVHPSGWLPTV